MGLNVEPNQRTGVGIYGYLEKYKSYAYKQRNSVGWGGTTGSSVPNCAARPNPLSELTVLVTLIRRGVALDEELTLYEHTVNRNFQ